MQKYIQVHSWCQFSTVNIAFIHIDFFENYQFHKGSKLTHYLPGRHTLQTGVSRPPCIDESSADIEAQIHGAGMELWDMRVYTQKLALHVACQDPFCGKKLGKC